MQPQIFVLRRFFRSRSSHVSLVDESEFGFESSVDRAAYVCLSGTAFDEAVDVDCKSETVAFSASKWTAIENRFQNAGSRTPAMSKVGYESSFCKIFPGGMCERLRDASQNLGMVCADVCCYFGPPKKRTKRSGVDEVRHERVSTQTSKWTKKQRSGRP